MVREVANETLEEVRHVEMKREVERDAERILNDML